MKYAGLNKNDFVNGEGVCVSLFTQGCPFHCKGCHNPETWDFNGGIEINEQDLINDVLAAIPANGIQRSFSILGGEPLCEQNINFVYRLIATVRQAFPQIKIYLWTGYELDQFTSMQKEIALQIDVLIAGPYIQELRDITLPLRGSSNQQIWRSIDKRKK